MAKPDVTHLASAGRPLNHWGVVAGFIHMMMALRRWWKIPQNRHPIITPFPAVRLIWCVKDCWGVMIFRFYHWVGHSLIAKKCNRSLIMFIIYHHLSAPINQQVSELTQPTKVRYLVPGRKLVSSCRSSPLDNLRLFRWGFNLLRTLFQPVQCSPPKSRNRSNFKK